MIVNNISGAHPYYICFDIVKQIMSFLETRDIVNLGSVNKELCTFSRDKNLYDEDVFRIKDIYSIYIQKQFEYEFCQKNLQSLQISITNKRATVIAHQKSWSGYLVSKLNNSSWLVSRVIQLFIKIFSSMKNALAQQNQLNQELDSLITDQKETLNALPVLQENIDILYKKYLNTGSFTAKVHALFGGTAAYNALPVHKKRTLNSLDGISRNLTAPIMRGIAFCSFRDSPENDFFVIRVRHKITNEIRSILYYEITKDTWNLYHSKDMLMSPLDSTNFQQQVNLTNTYKQLRDLIKHNGEINGYTLY